MRFGILSAAWLSSRAIVEISLRAVDGATGAIAGTAQEEGCLSALAA